MGWGYQPCKTGIDIMLFEQFEIDVRDQLIQSLGSGVEVELEPEVEGQNKTPFAKPRVSILFDQSEFEKQLSTQYIGQSETGRCAIIIRSRKLRGPDGIYTTTENVRISILGFAPTNWSKIWLQKFVFLKKENGLWEYALIIASKSMVVEDAPADTGPTLQSATATYTDSQYN